MYLLAIAMITIIKMIRIAIKTIIVRLLALLTASHAPLNLSEIGPVNNTAQINNSINEHLILNRKYNTRKK